MTARSALADQFSIAAPTVATVNSAAWVANSSGAYGRAINGNSFETSTISTLNGYQYTAFWQNVAGSGKVAIARRAVGTTNWQTVTLSNSITNGPNDAHNVISMGLDPTDGTIHLAYDMHGHTLRYRMSAANVLTNPSAVAWTAANVNNLFVSPEQNWLVNSASPVNTVTYPMFIRTPNNDLQFAYRTGASGAGSWFFADYNGTSHTWSNNHQIDDGFTGTYTGTVTQGDANRNDYPNGWTYDANGRLHSVFTYREGATGAANHDLMYVYSDDGGNIWKNNAGAIVSNKATGLKFNLNTPGLIVRPLDESQTLMNQQGQAVDHANQIHSVGWHRDSAKDPSSTTSTPWEPQESSYFHNWRDDAGNWHETKLPGNVGARPKIFFDANDNAYAIYQVKAGGGDLSGGTGSNLYIANGDLVISAASKASNWTDWKIIRTETGNFVSEAQADPELFASTGILSVIMQSSPTLTGNQGTALKTFDYDLTFTAPATRAFIGAPGSDFASASNWSTNVAPGTNTILTLNGGRSARISSTIAPLDNMLRIGAGGSAGSLDVADGATLDLLHTGLLGSQYGGSIIVGADGGSVGTYSQSGGAVSAWRFAVGDYATTSGGGVSSATVSGGSLTTNEIDVAFSANASSSGSTFNVSGGAVNVNGDIILGEFGNSATLNLTGGVVTVAGNVREGFNKTNTSTVILDGGELDMTSARIDVDTLKLNSGRLRNVAGFRAGSILKNTNGTVSLAGANTFTNAIQIDAGAIRAESNTALGAAAGSTTIGGGTTTGRLELVGGITLNEPITLAGRQPEVAAPHLENVSGNNVLAGTMNMSIGGNQYNVQSDADTLTVTGNLINSLGSNATDMRTLNLSGAGNGAWNTTLADSVVGGTNAARTAITKSGAGTWRLNGANSFSGTTTVRGGTLEISAASRNALTNAGGLDITGGSADFLYAAASPAATIVPMLKTAYAAGFAGTQIRSATADARHVLGWADDGAGTFRIAYTLSGDANLDSAVGFDDLLAVAQAYGTPSDATWVVGDFNYDGAVGFDDLLALAQNYGASLGGTALQPNAAAFAPDWALAQSLVPEPGTLSIALAALLVRRRRSARIDSDYSECNM